MQSRLRRSFLKSPPSFSSSSSCCCQVYRFCSIIESSSSSPSPSPPEKPILQALARIKHPQDAISADYYRSRGLVTAVVCDGMISDPRNKKRGHLPQQTTSLLLFLKEKDVSGFLQKMGHRVFMSTVFFLHISSHFNDAYMENTMTQLVLPRTVNFDNNGRITNLRFIKAVEGVKMKLNCPLVVSGAEECIGIKRGGILKRYYSYLPLSCVPERLPTAVEVDVSKLDLGQVMVAGDMQIQCKVDLHPDLDPASPICEILTMS